MDFIPVGVLSLRGGGCLDKEEDPRAESIK